MKKEYFCKNCKKKLLGRNKSYCNNRCQGDYQYKQYIIRWKQGLETGLRGRYALSNHVCRYLREKYDNKCHKCGWSKINQFTNTVPLEVEHIDGNYLNNVENNLDLLCPNCHSLTSTYKGANKGNGRKERYKYYL